MCHGWLKANAPSDRHANESVYSESSHDSARRPSTPPNSPYPALVIDDLDESAACLSSLGQCLMRDDIASLRQILLEHALSHGWRVLSYSSFVDWSIDLADNTVVVVADKLYPRGRLHGPLIEVDAHRHWTGSMDERVVSLQAPRFRAHSTDGITVIDDAAYSGRTLQELRKQINLVGGTIDHVVVAAISTRAERLLRAENVRVSALAVVPAHWDILHARDFSPWLPYSGRKLRSLSKPIEHDLALRISPLFYNRGAWLQLDDTENSYVRLNDLAIRLIDRLEIILGRSAVPHDVQLLGRNVSLPITWPQAVDSLDLVNTGLREIVGRTNDVGD